MALWKNIAANYAGALIAAVSPLLAVPLYLSALGPARWGLVSFATTLASLFSLLEVGLSQRLVRDLTIARLRQQEGAAAAFRGIEACYWVLGSVGALVMLAMDGLLVGHWLHLEQSWLRDGYATVHFAALLTFTQIPNSVYRSGLLASDRHLTLNLQIASFAVCKHAAGVIVAMVWKDLRYVYVCYAVTALVEVAIRGWTARRALSSAAVLRVDWRGARAMLAAGAKMSIAVVMAVLTLQSDKLFLSRFATLHDLGIYGVAQALAYGPLQLTFPLLTSVTPALAAAVSDHARLQTLCRRLLGGVFLSLIVAIICYFAIGEWLVSLWLRNRAVFVEVRPLLRLLLIGTALNVVYQVSYQRWLVMGNTRWILAVNAVSLIVAVTLTPAFIATWGTAGAAGGWIALNAVGVLVNVRWMCGYG
jgi:O-antigen/teichoic acid export membrane protein